jgi:predicted Zn-dependent protease
MFRPYLLALAVLVGGFALTRWWLAPSPKVAAPVVQAAAPAVQTPMGETRQSLPAPRPYSSPAPIAPATAAAETPERKVARLKQALAKDPENPQLLYYLGLALARDLHAPEEGIPHLEKSVKGDPNNGNAFYDLVGAYLESGNADRGAQFLEEIVQSDIPNKAAAYAALGDLRSAAGDPNAAIPDMEAAHAADPKSPVMTAMLASTHLQAGDPVRAESMMKLTEQMQRGIIQELRAEGKPTQGAQQELDGYLRSHADFLAQSRRMEELQQLSTTASNEVKAHIEKLLKQGGG